MAREWKNVDQALDYLARADGIPHRAEGEAALLDEVSPERRRLLDLGDVPRQDAVTLPDRSGLATDGLLRVADSVQRNRQERSALRVRGQGGALEAQACDPAARHLRDRHPAQRHRHSQLCSLLSP
jgi:hypothetical protein